MLSRIHLLYVICIWGILCGVASFRTWDDFWNNDPYLAKLVSLERNSHLSGVIIGDSVIATNFPEDKDQRGIDQILSDKLGKEVFNLARAGTSLATHEYILDFLIQKKVTADLLVLELNPLHIMRLDNQEKLNEWQEELNMMVGNLPGYVKFLNHIFTLDQKLLHPPEKTSYVDYSGHNGLIRLGAYDLDRLEKMKVLIKNAESLASQISTKIVFFIPPINLAALKRESSLSIKQKREATVEAIASTCVNLPVTFINLYDALPYEKYFPDVGYCHLNDEGRQFVVDAILREL